MTASQSPTAYKAAGVDVALGDRFSAFAGDVSRKSWKNNKFWEVRDFTRGHFRGPRPGKIVNYPKEHWTITGSDGSGSKPIFSSATFTHWNAGSDLLGMVAEDVTRWGGCPIHMQNDLSAYTLGKDENSTVYQSYCQMMQGLAELACKHNIVLMGGETAELRHSISSEIQGDNHTKFVWSAAMTGLFDPDRLINGDNLREGHVFIALRDGIRANGVSAVRKMMRERYGDEWYNSELAEVQQLMIDAAKPTTIYSSFLTDANGWNSDSFEPTLPISLICHITGGGFKGKFADTVKELGFSATLYDLYDAPLCVTETVKHSKMSNPDAYETFCCGNGLVFAIPESHATQALNHAQSFGLQARVCGRVSKPDASPRVKICSKFDGEEFEI